MLHILDLLDLHFFNLREGWDGVCGQIRARVGIKCHDEVCETQTVSNTSNIKFKGILGKVRGRYLFPLKII